MAEAADIDQQQQDSSSHPTYSVPESFYTFKGRGATNGTWIFQCKKCVGSKAITSSAKSRYNLRQHLKSKHSQSLQAFDNACSDNRRKQVQSSAKTETTSSHSSGSPTILDRLTTGRKLLSQSQLDKCIVTYLTESVLPFHHVQSSGFKAFIQHLAPGFEVKTAKTYQRLAYDLFKELKDSLTQSLTNARKVCLTIDHWSSYRKGYIGITAHWFEVQNEELAMKHACIALRRIYGRVTYDVLANTINSVMAEYGLSPAKISHCVTDSGSNFVKAFKEFSICNFPSDLDTSDGEEENVEALQAATIDSELSDHDGDGPNNQDVYRLPVHFRCSAHRLNLIASKDSLMALENPTFKKCIEAYWGSFRLYGTNRADLCFAVTRSRRC